MSPAKPYFSSSNPAQVKACLSAVTMTRNLAAAAAELWQQDVQAERNPCQ